MKEIRLRGDGTELDFLLLQDVDARVDLCEFFLCFSAHHNFIGLDRSGGKPEIQLNRFICPNADDAHRSFISDGTCNNFVRAVRNIWDKIKPDVVGGGASACLRKNDVCKRNTLARQAVAHNTSNVGLLRRDHAAEEKERQH